MPLAYEEIKDHKEIRAIISSNVRFSEELEKCLRELCKYESINDIDAGVEAFTKSADAIVNGIKIFVSFPVSCSDFAQTFLDTLWSFDDNKRLCREGRFPYMFARSESRAVGQVYSTQVLEALRLTHWMFIIVPSEVADAQWVVFEAGAFAGSMLPMDRLICIHHPAVERIKPLQGFDTTSVTEPDLSRMFKKLYSDTGSIPGIKSLIEQKKFDEEINRNIPRILDASNQLRPTKELFVVREIELCLQSSSWQRDISNGDNEQDPLSSLRLIRGTRFEEVFGVQSLPSTLGELLVNVFNTGPEDIKNWKKQLGHALRDIVAGRPPSPVDVAFLDYRSQRPFRSFLVSYCERDRPREVLSARLGFQEAIVFPSNRAPWELEVLEAALRLSYRFRWDVIEESRGVIRVSDLERMEARIVAAEQEARYRNAMGRGPLEEIFEGDDRTKVKEIVETWEKYRSPDGRSGILDIAFQNKNNDSLNKVRNSIDLLERLNGTFMRIGSKRFQDLVGQYWTKN